MNPPTLMDGRPVIEWLIDIVLAFMIVEFAVLAWRRRRRASDVLTLAIALAPGVCLVMALRVELAGAGWVGVGACLALALPFHVWDLRRRKP